MESWATECEIQAAATFYGLQVHIQYYGEIGKDWITFGPEGSETANGEVRMVLKHDHFNSQVLAEALELEESTERTTDEWDWFNMERNTLPREERKKGDDLDQESSRGSGHGEKRKGNGSEQIAREMMQKCRVSRQKKNEKKVTKAEEVGEKRKTSEKQKKGVSVVTNMSSKVLSEEQESLLNKGLSFIPTKRSVDKTRLLADLAELERRMRLHEYFLDTEGGKMEEKEEEKWKRKKSSFTPEQGRSKWLVAYIEAVKGDVMASLKNRIQMNVSAEEETALRELLKDDTIVIRPADKGSGIVLVDKEDNVRKLESEVGDDTSYEITDSDRLKVVERGIKKLTNRLHREGIIDGDLKSYLLPRYPKAGQLKGNPKVHKKGNPYRTIVNGKGSHTERMAEVAEKELES